MGDTERKIPKNKGKNNLLYFRFTPSVYTENKHIRSKGRPGNPKGERTTKKEPHKRKARLYFAI